MTPPPSIGIIGAGKVGTVLARLLVQAGVSVTAVASRTPEHADALARSVGARAVASPRDVVQYASLILLTVPDDAVSDVVAHLADVDGQGRAFVHTSGALDASVLAPLASHGAMIGSLHPVYPFADVDAAVRGLPGATFAVEADDARLMDWLVGVVALLNGRVLVIPPGTKARYHAALVLASNYTVTLYAVAESLLAGLGAEPDTVRGALNPLVQATIENLVAHGIPAALTGPLVRADVGTIAAHLRALEAVDPRLADVYRELARLSYPMLVARGVLPDAVEQHLLRQEQHHA